MPVRRPVAATLAALCLVLGLVSARPARALTCVPLSETIPRLDVAVEGKVLAIPGDGTVRLRVNRYYKGTGPAVLVGQVDGLAQGTGRMDWQRAPRVGDRLLIGFTEDMGKPRNTVCNLFEYLAPGEEPPAPLREWLGPGQPPEGGAEERADRLLLWLIPPGVLALGFLLWRLRHRAVRKGPPV